MNTCESSRLPQKLCSGEICMRNACTKTETVYASPDRGDVYISKINIETGIYFGCNHLSSAWVMVYIKNSSGDVLSSAEREIFIKNKRIFSFDEFRGSLLRKKDQIVIAAGASEHHPLNEGSHFCVNYWMYGIDKFHM